MDDVLLQISYNQLEESIQLLGKLQTRADFVQAQTAMATHKLLEASLCLALFILKRGQAGTVMVLFLQYLGGQPFLHIIWPSRLKQLNWICDFVILSSSFTLVNVSSNIEYLVLCIDYGCARPSCSQSLCRPSKCGREAWGRCTG